MSSNTPSARPATTPGRDQGSRGCAGCCHPNPPARRQRSTPGSPVKKRTRWRGHRRPHRDTHGHVRIALVVIWRCAPLSVFTTHKMAWPTLSESTQPLCRGTGRRRENLSGLSCHTNAAAHVLGGQTVDRKRPDVALQLHAAGQDVTALGNIRTHVRRLTRCDPPDASIEQCHLPETQRRQIRHRAAATRAVDDARAVRQPGKTAHHVVLMRHLARFASGRRRHEHVEPDAVSLLKGDPFAVRRPAWIQK